MDEHTHQRGPFSTNRKFVSMVIAIALLSGGFYWYQMRPMQIRETCALDAGSRAFVNETNKDDLKGMERLRYQNESFESFYKLCVRTHGLAE